MDRLRRDVEQLALEVNALVRQHVYDVVGRVVLKGWQRGAMDDRPGIDLAVSARSFPAEVGRPAVWTDRAWVVAPCLAVVAALEAELGDPDLYARDPEAFNRKSTRIGTARDELDAIEMEWLEIEEKRDALANS